MDSMTVVLAIAVVLLAAGLVYALVSRREEPRARRRTSGRRSRRRPRRRSTRPAARQRGGAQGRREGRRGRPSTSARPRSRRWPSGSPRARRRSRAEVRERGETDLQTRALLEQMGQTVGNLNSETAGLKKALRQPQTRGQWGELQLRRCVEIAGMTEHVDFELQETLRTEDGRLRPDARFLLPEGRSFVADSKVPLDAFLDAQEAEVESERRVHLERHARQAREHVRSAQLEGLPGPVQGRRDAGPGDLLHPQRARPARRLRRRPRALRLRAGAQRAAGQPDLADRAAADDGAGLAPGADGRRGGRDRRGGEHPARPLLASSSATSTRSASGLDSATERLRLRGRLDGAAAAAAAAQGRGPRRRRRARRSRPPEPVEITVREITAPELREASPETTPPERAALGLL